MRGCVKGGRVAQKQLERERRLSLTTHPDFVPSLRALIEGQEYSSTDVGLIFGVSRERARQWIVKYGIAQRGKWRGRHSRVWDDARNQFRPVRAPEYKRVMPQAPKINRRTGTPSRSRADRMVERLTKRAEIVVTIRALAERLGRTPTVKEMSLAVSGDVTGNARSLVAKWGGMQRGRSAGLLAEIRGACGLVARPYGSPGHVIQGLRGPRKAKAQPPQ